MEEAYALVKKSLSYGVDAFIVQDLGVIQNDKILLRMQSFHGSTQMSIVTPEGVHALKEMGISRAVLPKRVNCRGNCRDKRKTDLELEMFIHGALCMSVSGQCYLSPQCLSQRSGNRGLCAQPCRLSFSADNSKSLILA